jgi:hypothetical protein
MQAARAKTHLADLQGSVLIAFLSSCNLRIPESQARYNNQ